MSWFYFFFSSRRRHTRCSLVTGFQTCALPICLLGQVRGNSYSWQQAAEITAEKNRFHVDEAIMGHSTIADIDEIAGADLARLAETPTLDDMRQMDSEAKLRLLAYCVASQITSLSFH